MLDILRMIKQVFFQRTIQLSPQMLCPQPTVEWDWLYVKLETIAFWFNVLDWQYHTKTIISSDITLPDTDGNMYTVSREEPSKAYKSLGLRKYFCCVSTTALDDIIHVCQELLTQLNNAILSVTKLLVWMPSTPLLCLLYLTKWLLLNLQNNNGTELFVQPSKWHTIIQVWPRTLFARSSVDHKSIKELVLDIYISYRKSFTSSHFWMRLRATHLSANCYVWIQDSFA